MVQIAVFKQRIAEGKGDLLREWGSEVSERKDEALASMAADGIYTQAAFIEHDDDARYLVSFIEAEDAETAKAAFEPSGRDIDAAFHQVLADAVVSPEPTSEFESVYALAHPDRP